MRWIERISQWTERRRLRQRALFVYHDGSRQRFADPAAVWRALLNHPKFDFSSMILPANQGQEPERTITLDALAEIFAVQRWNEATRQGLLEWELLDLVRQFDEYLVALKKNTSPSRMPWQLSGYEQPTSSAQTPGVAPAEPTSSSAGFSSMPIESNAAEDMPSSAPSPMG